MDEADISEERERIARETAIAHLMKNKPTRPDPNGECYACGEIVSGHKLFCDKSCAEHFELQRSRRR